MTSGTSFLCSKDVSTTVVIPAVCREALLTELHEGHLGVSRMKGLARMYKLYVWWPGITKDVENMVRHWLECEQ